MDRYGYWRAEPLVPRMLGRVGGDETDSDHAMGGRLRTVRASVGAARSRHRTPDLPEVQEPLLGPPPPPEARPSESETLEYAVAEQHHRPINLDLGRTGNQRRDEIAREREGCAVRIHHHQHFVDLRRQDVELAPDRGL